ncbi:hypothetical protein ACP8Y2_01875 [Herpetosiphon llansteffanensis]
MRRKKPLDWATLGPIAVLLGLLLLIVNQLNQPKTRYAPLGAYFSDAAASVPQSQVTPLPPTTLQAIEQSNTAGSSNQIDLVLETELYQDQSNELAGELQSALDYVQERTNIRLSERVTVVISQDAQCGFHGVTYSDVRVIYIYSCAGVARSRVVNIAAHEFVHQLQQDRYGAAHLSADLALSEGFATWGAGRYWLGSASDFSSFARDYRANGQALPLSTHYASVGIDGMNVLYYQWASFVDYLINSYGREAFDQLYISGGERQPGAANYAAIYNRSFGLLEAEWQQTLD